MNPERWTAVDDYLSNILVGSDPVLEAASQAAIDAGLPPISVTPNQGKFLQLLARGMGARRILEIGTLAGYSTLWLARALPADGRLVTLEFEPKHAEVARANFTRANIDALVDLRVGPALDSLPRIAVEGSGPFDFIFIDADKENYPSYFTWAVRLARAGTLIVADNVVRDGAVIDDASSDPRVHGVRQMHELIAQEKRVSATAIQTVGSKGYDGFTLAMVTG